MHPYFLIILMIIFALFMMQKEPVIHNTNTLKHNYKPKHLNPFLIKDPEVNTSLHDIYPDFNKQKRETSYSNFSDIEKIESQLRNIQFKPMDMNVTKQNTIIPLNELSGVMNRVMCAINKVCDNMVLVGIHKSNRAIAEFSGQKWATYTLHAEMYNVNANQTLQFMIYVSVHINSGSKIPDFKIHSVNLSTMYMDSGKEIFKKLERESKNELYNLNECPQFSAYIVDN